MTVNIDKAKALARVEEMKINYCCSIFGIDKVDVIRWGIDDLFMTATEIEAFFPELAHLAKDRNK